MAAWVGLVGALAGAVIALSGQYLSRRSEVLERYSTLLLEQAVVLVALSEDYRNRIWEERHQLASNVVAAWDYHAYRLADARLRILCRDPEVLSAMNALDDAGGELGAAWRVEPEAEAKVQAAWTAHDAALAKFIAASSRLVTRKHMRATPPQRGGHELIGTALLVISDLHDRASNSAACVRLAPGSTSITGLPRAGPTTAAVCCHTGGRGWFPDWRR
jgi:hypothetical protein